MNWTEKKTVIARGLRRLADAISEANTQEMLMKDYGKAMVGLVLIVNDQAKKLSDLTAQLAAATAAAPDAEDAAELTAAQAVIAANPVVGS